MQGRVQQPRAAAGFCSRLHPAMQHRPRAPKRTEQLCNAASAPPASVKPESEVPGMSAYLDSLKWDKSGLVAAIAQVRALERWRGM